jgi:hypothetical protein
MDAVRDTDMAMKRRRTTASTKPRSDEVTGPMMTIAVIDRLGPE